MINNAIICPYCNQEIQTNLSPVTTFHKIICKSCQKDFIVEIKFYLDIFYKPTTTQNNKKEENNSVTTNHTPKKPDNKNRRNNNHIKGCGQNY